MVFKVEVSLSRQSRSPHMRSHSTLVSGVVQHFFQFGFNLHNSSIDHHFRSGKGLFKRSFKFLRAEISPSSLLLLSYVSTFCECASHLDQLSFSITNLYLLYIVQKKTQAESTKTLAHKKEQAIRADCERRQNRKQNSIHWRVFMRSSIFLN